MAERDIDITELPLDSAGARLRRAREQAGLSLADIAARTKIAERHLVSIEQGNYAALASRAYAIGFARNFARALGLDEKEIAASVRDDFDDMVSATDRRPPPAFEPGDPARVPGSRLAWIAALSALAAILVTALVWHNFYTPGATLPDLTAPKAETPAEQVQPAAAAAPNGPVVFTATIPAVWVKFYDADGKQLLQKELAQGESFTVPPDAKGPMLWTARPDALQVTIGGQEVPRISTKQENVKDVPVSAAALLARPAGSPSAAAPPSAPASPAAQEATRTSATVRVPLTDQTREARPARSNASASPSPVAADSPAPQPSTVSD